MQLCLCIQQTLEVTGGTTGERTVFPAVEAWLEEDSDRYHAFEKLKGRKDARRYRSLIDFLLCEVCPEEKAGCFAFYRDDGPCLGQLRTKARIRFLESKLMLFLTISYEAWCQSRALSWRQAVAIVEELCAAA